MPRQSLSQLETAHLKCRSWAHAWDYEVSYVERVGNSRILELHLHCERCDGYRIDTFDRPSQPRLISRKYVYPEGYVVVDLKRWGGRRHFNQSVQGELFSRFTPSKRKEKRVS